MLEGCDVFFNLRLAFPNTAHASTLVQDVPYCSPAFRVMYFMFDSRGGVENYGAIAVTRAERKRFPYPDLPGTGICSMFCYDS